MYTTPLSLTRRFLAYELKPLFEFRKEEPTYLYSIKVPLAISNRANISRPFAGVVSSFLV